MQKRITLPLASLDDARALFDSLPMRCLRGVARRLNMPDGNRLDRSALVDQLSSGLWTLTGVQK
jgi:hypothetical protein